MSFILEPKLVGPTIPSPPKPIDQPMFLQPYFSTQLTLSQSLQNEAPMDYPFLGSSSHLIPTLCFCSPHLLLYFPFSHPPPNLYLKNFLHFSLLTLLSSHSLKTSAYSFLQLPFPKKSPVTQLYGTSLFSFLTCFNHHHGKVVTSFATRLNSLFMESRRPLLN